MKTFATLGVSLLALFFISCEKSSKNIAIDVDITVLNQQGQNLLAAPALYTKADVNIYYIINGEVRLFEYSKLPTEGKFNYEPFEITNEGTSRIRIYLNYDVNRKERTALTLVKFGTSKTDTIKGEFDFKGRNVVLNKVWFNGQLKSQQFIIVK